MVLLLESPPDMSTVDVKALADELSIAYADGRTVPPPSARGIGFDMPAAYAVEAALVQMRRERGIRTVGRKVGFANKAVWRILKLETLVWAHMYDNTVRYAAGNDTSLEVSGCISPRIEPEIVFGLKVPMTEGSSDAGAILEHVDWLALGLEVNDCVFPDWQFQPADFVAAFGLHLALIVGEPQPVSAHTIGAHVEQLPRFKLRLLKNEELVEEGSGKNSLRSPALCLGELAGVVARGTSPEPLMSGEIVSTGTLTASPPIAAGETWTAEVVGLDLPPLTLRLS